MTHLAAALYALRVLPPETTPAEREWAAAEDALTEAAAMLLRAAEHAHRMRLAASRGSDSPTARWALDGMVRTVESLSRGAVARLLRTLERRETRREAAQQWRQGDDQ